MESNLNPDIKKLYVGRRVLREVEILPLSAADQFKLDKLLTESFELLSSAEKTANADLFVNILNFIKAKVPELLGYVTEDEDIEVLLTQLTNNQISELALFIYQVNYEGLAKNVKSLLGKLQERIAEQEAPKEMMEVETAE